MKICPTCGLQAALHATQCQQCGHLFRTQFAPNQTQQVQTPGPTPPTQHPQFGYSQPYTNIPPAPTPPTFWERFWNPLAGQKYQVELLAYMNQNGLITPKAKNRAVLLASILGVALVVFVVLELIASYKFNRQLDEQMIQDMNRASQELPPGTGQ